MARHKGDPVAMRVVTFLGVLAMIGALGCIFLVHGAMQYDKVDPGTFPLINSISNFAAAALGALGAILASTGKGVTVENPPSDPVPTAPVPDPAPPAVADPPAV